MRGEASEALLLGAMPGTQADLAARTGLSGSTVSRVATKLGRDGRAHVSRWLAPGPAGSGPMQAVWAAGAGEHALRPGTAKPEKRTPKRPAAPARANPCALHAAFFGGLSVR